MRRVALLLAAVVLISATAAAQFGLPRQLSRRAPMATDPSGALPAYDGGFRFCRIMFRNGIAGDGDGWFVDYPRADENLSIRLMETTRTRVTQDGEGNPYPVIVRLTDPSLFRCPFVMMSEPGGSFFSDSEAENLRAYLLKGGFLWVDDFWGERAWRNWENQIGKALPPSEFPIFDLTVDHPMFRMLFPVSKLPQIPNVGLWRSFRQTSERPDSAQVHVRGIEDRHGRVIVLMTHNTDFGDAYERESDDPSYFETFSVNGYAIGIDVLLYAMTH
ncbi:MAG TPA: DUF4159 domain-containing protein [Vicinamibacterales bacterium]|nr:DUF4159 domain-containing protein [Vicinamibacterales bacterium]